MSSTGRDEKGWTWKLSYVLKIQSFLPFLCFLTSHKTQLPLTLENGRRSATDWGFVVQVLDKIIKGVENFGFCSKGWIESPLKGAEGNTEFLVYFSRTAKRNANWFCVHIVQGGLDCWKLWTLGDKFPRDRVFLQASSKEFPPNC